MATVETKSEVEHWRKWKKANPGFPLTVAPCGSWCKKVRGRTHYFGPLREKDEALDRWLEDKDYLLAGMDPPALAAGSTVEELLDLFLEDCDDRISQGGMEARSKREYVKLRNVFRSAGIAKVAASQVNPTHFAALRRAIADGRSLRTQRNYIISVRTVFNWAVGMEYIESVRFGPRFKCPSSIDIEAEQEGKSRFVDRGAILDILSRADARMQVAVLLGINCAFGPGDLIAITLDDIHLDTEIPNHGFRRTKNNRRRAAALWPETVAAIRRYIDGDRRPRSGSVRTLILAANGKPYGENGDITLANEFKAILKQCGGWSRGVSLGSLRHTYATVVDRHADTAMIDLTMGHIGQGLRRRVYRQLHLEELERLQSIAQIVHDWLFVPSVGR